MFAQDPYAYQMRSPPSLEDVQKHRAGRIATEVWNLAATIFPQLVSFELALDKQNKQGEGDDWKAPSTTPDFERLAADAMNRSLLCAWRAVEHGLAQQDEAQERALKLAEKYPAAESSCGE